MDQKVFALLKNWCDTMLDLQIRELKHPALVGGVLCPACGLLHGRTADLSYALTVLWRETSERRYLDSAIQLVEWTDRNMKNHLGLYHNDYNAAWYGTAAFFADSMFEALSAGGGVLPEDVHDVFYSRFMQQTSLIYEHFREPGFSPVVNYYAAAAAVMAERFVLTGEDKYKAFSLEKAAKCLQSVTDDGLLFGEGTPHFMKSAHGFADVDMGYDIEESIPFLMKTGKLLGDSAMLERAKKLMLTAIEFVLPDGGLDNSWGVRSAKWTYYGSRTSDGMQCGLMLCPEEPVFVEAAYRSFACMERCTVDGLLAGGAMYGLAGQNACVHHAFTHSKALAAMCMSGIDFSTQMPLPSETRRGIRSFASAGVHLIGTGECVGSVYVGDSSNTPKSVCIGGSLTMLWSKKVGAVIAATQSRFALVEPKNMQYIKDDSPIHCMTPRIERGEMSSVFNRNVVSSVDQESGNIAVRGTICGANDARDGGGFYEMRYRFFENSVEIRAYSESEADFVLPLIARPDERIVLRPGGAAIAREGGTVTVRSDAEAGWYYDGDNAETRHFNPCGGFLYTVLCFRLPKGAAKTIVISID